MGADSSDRPTLHAATTRRRDDRQPTVRACLPMRARAGDPTGVRSSIPTHNPGRLTSFLLRHHRPAPNDGVSVTDLRPLTRSALPGRSWTPTPQPALPKNGGERKKKRSTSREWHSLTGPVLSGMTRANLTPITIHIGRRKESRSGPDVKHQLGPACQASGGTTQRAMRCVAELTSMGSRRRLRLRGRG